MQTLQKFGSEFITIFQILLLCFGLQSSASADDSHTSPVLRCKVSYAGTTQTIDTSFLQDPYLAPMHDIGGRFSFKAVMVGTNSKIDYIKLYAYLQGRELDTPIHQAIYRKPILISKKMKALTPFNHLYAGEVEREMQYQCFLGGAQK